MPSNNNFDDILKNKFEEFEAPLPKGGFGAIKGRIPERKKRGFLLPFFAAASIFFATLSGYLFLKQYDTSTNNNAVSTSKINNSNTIDDAKVIAIKSTTSEALSNEEELNQIKSNNINNTEASTFVNNLLASNDLNTLESSIDNSIEINNNQVELPQNQFVSNNTIVNQITPVNDINKGINPILLRHIVLAETNGVTRNLIGPIALIIEEESSSDSKEEEDNKDRTFHYGISASPIYTSKRISTNETDDIYVSNVEDISQITSLKSGLNAGLVLMKDITPKLAITSKIDFTSIRDYNKFEIVEKLDAPILVSNDGNSMTMTSYKKSTIENQSSYLYTGINAGLQYKIGNTSYVAVGSGAHYLLSSKDSNPNANAVNNELNYSSSFSLGRTYNLGDKLSMAIEPELKLFYKAFQQNGVYQSKPYTVGLNFVLMR